MLTVDELVFTRLVGWPSIGSELTILGDDERIGILFVFDSFEDVVISGCGSSTADIASGRSSELFESASSSSVFLRSVNCISKLGSIWRLRFGWGSNRLPSESLIFWETCVRSWIDLRPFRLRSEEDADPLLVG
jgi:hypothetical protein